MPYPWIIWYIWKARNDKLFRGIDRDPLELVRYAESEFQAWYNARDSVPIPTQEEANSFTFGTGSATVGNGEYAITLDLSEVWNGLQGSDCNDRTTTSLAELLN
uniref:Uncharacterized protein n=1 Tax=Brassica oleracea TaxID=3712 RepID=A0A3P6GJD4_BRAOL|nr:unnamed protein product [Brassica oleracea]